MPARTVDRRGQDVEGHLAAAVEYIKIAESGDASRSAYEHAADEIIAAQEEDSTLTFREVDRRMGRKTTGGSYAGTLVRWRESGKSGTPFAGDTAQNRASDLGKTKRVARERPDDYVKAFEQAPAEAKRQIAKQISRTPEVRAAARQHDADVERKRRPEAVTPRADLTLHQYEGKLFSARRLLREALALVDSIDQPGNDEDILELLEMLKQLADANDQAYRSGKSLDTWAWELYERSAD